MNRKSVDMLDAQKRLPELVSSLRTGLEIILTKDNVPIARLTQASSVSSGKGKRIAGLHPGAMTESSDFNDPLPESFWAGQE